MKLVAKSAIAAAVLAGLPAAGLAEESVSLILNWTAGADHAPLYYALDQGWYAEAGIALDIQPGKGSGLAAQNVGVGATDIGIAEVGTALLAKSKGAELTAVMALYANSPFTLYWKKSSGIETVKDFPGKTVGNPAGDAARVMWPAFAKAAGLPEDAVSFVNVAPPAKLPTLVSGRVDIISDFYNGHDQKIKELGDDLGFIRWSELGLNPYGNSFIVNNAFLAEHKDTVKAFVEVTQRAYAACVATPSPCMDSLLAHASGLQKADMEDQWGRVVELMTTDDTVEKGLGWFGEARVKDTYDLVNTYFELETQFDPATAFTNEFLNTDVKMVSK